MPRPALKPTSLAEFEQFCRRCPEGQLIEPPPGWTIQDVMDTWPNGLPGGLALLARPSGRPGAPVLSDGAQPWLPECCGGGPMGGHKDWCSQAVHLPAPTPATAETAPPPATTPAEAPPEPPPRPHRVEVTLSPEEMADLSELARLECRSLASTIRHAVARSLRAERAPK
jgi:hypothetical protein